MPRIAGILYAAVLALTTQDTNNPKEPLKVTDDWVLGLIRGEDSVPTRGEWGEWRRYFCSDTHGTKDMVVLAVTEKPGQAPHSPHRHAEEEFMILADGTGTWTLSGKEIAAKKGDLVFAAPWKVHGLKNAGDGLLTYYMVKWNNKGVPPPAEPKGEADKPAVVKDRVKGSIMKIHLRTAFAFVTSILLGCCAFALGRDWFLGSASGGGPGHREPRRSRATPPLCVLRALVGVP